MSVARSTQSSTFRLLGLVHHRLRHLTLRSAQSAAGGNGAGTLFGMVFPCPVIGELAVGIEQLVGAADIGFGLRHRRNIQEDKRLPQMMVGAEPVDTAWRGTDDCTRLIALCALATGARADIDRVLQHGWHRAVMLGRDEKNRVGCPDAFAKNAIHSAGGFSSPS